MWLSSHPKPGQVARRGVALCALIGATGAGSAAAAEPAPPSLKVSGKSAFTTDARAIADGFEVRATLNDEVGRPLPSAEVRARTSSDATSATLHRCGDPRGEAGGELLLNTDKAGKLCVNVTGMPSGSVELSYQDARGYFERTSRLVPLPQSVASSFEVGFDPPLAARSLDLPLQEVGVVVRSSNGAPLPEAAELIFSRSTDGVEHELSRIALDSLGDVLRLSLASTTFGQPGPTRLIAKLRGREGLELGQATAPVLLTVTVGISTAEASSSVEPGAVLHVRAASVLGPTPFGVIEARSRGISVAAAPVKDGVATLTIPNVPSLLGGTVVLEYVGAGAGWLSGPPLELRLQPPPPSYGRYAAWIAAAALAALAVVLGWRRPSRARPASATVPPRSRASVEVLETFGLGGGYRGFVRDAHEGFPISPAAVSFIGPTAQPAAPGMAPRGQGLVLAQLRTNAEGAFEVPSGSTFPTGTVIEVTAPFHATLRAALPVPGVLELSLTSRRRALLERLVRWAELKGKPWTQGAGEPTPAKVVEVATTEGEPQVGEWARRVEHLAFGAVPPDAASEQAAGVTDDPKLLRD
ncbi:MAG TPA: hypothetical protein VHB79_09175 [Polyangiaceae bacterium]|nr:hypothetical protein [Polyangiaceae bacterium]